MPETNNSRFENRDRFTEAEARRLLDDGKSNMILHLLDNGDQTFSIMGHIVCEDCDHCETQGDCRGNGAAAVAEPAKEHPYENRDRDEALCDVVQKASRYADPERLTAKELGELAQAVGNLRDDTATVPVTARQLSLLIRGAIDQEPVVASEEMKRIGWVAQFDRDDRGDRETREVER